MIMLPHPLGIPAPELRKSMQNATPSRWISYSSIRKINENATPPSRNSFSRIQRINAKCYPTSSSKIKDTETFAFHKQGGPDFQIRLGWMRWFWKSTVDGGGDPHDTSVTVHMCTCVHVYMRVPCPGWNLFTLLGLCACFHKNKRTAMIVFHPSLGGCRLAEIFIGNDPFWFINLLKYVAQ